MLGDPTQRVMALVYLVGSMVLGLLLAWTGFRVGDRVALSRRHRVT